MENSKLRMFNNKVFLSFLVLILLGSVAAQAQITWTGGATGSWNVATNWSAGTVPGVSDEVVISNATIDLGGSHTIAKLTTNNAALNIGGVSNTLTVNGGFSITGGQFTNGKVIVNSTTGATSISNASFYTEIEVTAPEVNTSSSQFHEIAKLTKTGGYSYSSGNTFHKDVTFIARGGYHWYVSNSSADTFKENIIVGGANGTYLHIGHVTNHTTYLLPGKAVIPDGTYAALTGIYFRGFHQQGTTPFSLQVPYQISSLSSTWNADVALKGSELFISDSEFLGKAHFTKTRWNASNNGNIYHKDVSFIGTGGYYWDISTSKAETFKENIIIGGGNGTALNIGHVTNHTTILLPGKSVIADGTYTNLSIVRFRGFHQQGTTPFTLQVPYQITSISSTWDADVDFEASQLSISNSEFMGTAHFTKTFAQSHNNGNTYHKDVTFIGRGGYQWYISNTAEETFKQNVTIGGDNGTHMFIGSDNFTTNLLPSKTITFDATYNGLSIATFKQFHQQGTTSQMLNTGSTVQMYSCTWEGALDVTAGKVYTTTSNYHENTSFTAGGPSSYSEGNTYQKQVSFIGNGLYNWYIGNTTPDNYGGKVIVRRTSSGQMYMAHGPGTHVFEHDLELQGLINFGENGGLSLFTGANLQSIKAVAGHTANAFFKKLTLDKTTNHIDLLTTLTVDEEMTFTNGKIKAAPKSTGLVIFDEDATYTGASTNSYVSGWVQKSGNANFIFPVGVDTQYRPLSMTNLSASAPITAYFVNAPEPSGVAAPKCTELSSCEHWVVNSSSLVVTFNLGVNIDNTCVNPFPTNPTLFWFDKTQWNALSATVSGSMLTATETATTVSNTINNGDHYVTIGSKISLPGGNTMTGATSACQGQSYTYTVPAQINTAYSWKLPIGWSIASTNQNSNQVTVTVGSNAQVGTQTISVIPSTVANCDFCELDPITLDVMVNAQSNVGSIVGLTTAKAGQSNITYSVTNTTGSNSFVWTLPNGVVENGTGATGTVTTTVPYINVDFVTGFAGGNINVYGTNATCGNGSTVSLFVSLCTTCRTSTATLADNLKNNHLTVYPNPIMGSETIKVKIEGETKVRVVNVLIFDEKGAQLKSYTKTLQNGLIEIPGQSLAAGKYLLRIQVGAEIVAKKILKY